MGRISWPSTHLPTVRAEASGLADEAARAALTHRAYLAEVLSAEVDQRNVRRCARRIVEARFPRIKRLSGQGSVATTP